MRRRAFTLVELLVVIAIIGLLSTVAVIATNNARAAARSARRTADIQQLFKAFSLAADANAGSYPAAGQACVSTVCGGAWAGLVASAAVDAYLAPYLPSKPTDPLEGKRTVTGYVYMASWTGTSSYDGYVFPSAPYLSWFTETLPSLVGICGTGHIYTTTSTQTQCLLQLNQ